MAITLDCRDRIWRATLRYEGHTFAWLFTRKTIGETLQLIPWQAWEKDTPFDWHAAAYVIAFLRGVFCR